MERTRTRRSANVADDDGAGHRDRPTRTARNERQATSEGNKAQEGEADEHPNTVFDGTDSLTEQGLEGPPPIDTAGDGSFGNGADDDSRGSTASEKSEEATVAAMRHGCEGGDSFGGYETRCEEAAMR